MKWVLSLLALAVSMAAELCSTACQQRCDALRLDFSCYTDCGCGSACSARCRDLCVESVLPDAAYGMCLAQCGCYSNKAIMAVSFQDLYPKGEPNFEVIKKEIHKVEDQHWTASEKQQRAKGETEYEDKMVTEVETLSNTTYDKDKVLDQDIFTDVLKGASTVYDVVDAVEKTDRKFDEDLRMVYQNGTAESHKFANTLGGEKKNVIEKSATVTFSDKEKVLTQGNSTITTDHDSQESTSFTQKTTLLAVQPMPPLQGLPPMQPMQPMQPIDQAEMQECVDTCVAACEGDLQVCLQDCLNKCMQESLQKMEEQMQNPQQNAVNVIHSSQNFPVLNVHELEFMQTTYPTVQPLKETSVSGSALKIFLIVAGMFTFYFVLHRYLVRSVQSKSARPTPIPLQENLLHKNL